MELTITNCSVCGARLECEVRVIDNKGVAIPSVMCDVCTDNRSWSIDGL